MALKKPAPPDNGAFPAAYSGLANSQLAVLTPTLWAMLADVSWEDGSPRTTSTMTVFAEAGLVKLCLNDRDGGATAWASAASFELACEALEARLKDGSLEWRRAGPRTAGKGRRG